MNTIDSILLSALLVTGYAQAAGAESKPPSGTEKFVIVPAGHTSLDGKSLPIIFSAWRLNSETGDLQFCIYDSGGVVIGKSVTPEALKCVSQTPAGKSR